MILNLIKSLRKYYKDEICVIINSNDKKIEIELKNYGCICLKTKIDKKRLRERF